MTAAEAYAARIDAVEAQAARLRAGRPPLPDLWGESVLRRFPSDPRRPLDPQLQALAAYLQAEAVLLDVGGGAGRVSLALAGRCREVVNVEPSPGMGEAFLAAATQAGIENARWVQSAWPGATEVAGDVALVSHVTYFVRDIVPFIAGLQRAARRRVLILLSSAPPPSTWAPFFPILFGEALEVRPGQRDLLPVLWELDILPDVRILPPVNTQTGAAATPEEAVTLVLQALGTWISADLTDDQRLRGAIEEHFDALIERTEQGFQGHWAATAPAVLITWPTEEPA